MVIVDARGLSCPEPVVMTRKAMADQQAQYQVLVDNFLFFITKSALFPKRRGSALFVLCGVSARCRTT